MSQKTQSFYLECPECQSRFHSEPLTLGVRFGRLVKIHPICPNCFSKCPLGHEFGYGERCNSCGASRRRFNLIRREMDPDDPNFGYESTGSTTYPTTTDTTGGTSSSFNPGTGSAYATKATLSASGTIKSCGINWFGAASINIRMGLYSHNAGSDKPDALQCESASTASIAGTGWQDIDMTTPAYCAAGTYWIAFILSGSKTIYGVASSGRRSFYVKAYGAFDATWSGSSTQDANAYSSRVTHVKIKNYAKTYRFTLSETAYVLSMSFYLHATGNFRLAIYNNSGGNPNALQWEGPSAPGSAAAWNSVEIGAGSPTTLQLTAGDYHLGWQWDSVNNGPSYTAGTAGYGNYIQQTYGAFPATWLGGTATAEEWSIYATYATVPLEQIHYRWYENDSAESPTARASEDTLTDLVQAAGVLRLRVSIKVQTGSLSGWTFKLQYATSSAGPWTDIGAQGGGVIWRYYNGLGTDQAQVANAFLTGTTVRQHFVETAPSATCIDMAANDLGEWDFCIQENSAATGTLYYFRVVKNDGTPLAYYTRYPTLTTYPSFIDYGSIIQYDPTKYSGTVTVYFEAQIKTNDSVRKAYARLWNIDDNQAVTGSLVSTTSISYSRQRTNSLSLPGAAKELKTQVGALQNMTASIKGARLVVDVT